MGLNGEYRRIKCAEFKREYNVTTDCCKHCHTLGTASLYVINGKIYELCCALDRDAIEQQKLHPLYSDGE